MDESSRTYIRRRGFLLGAAFALLVGMLIAIGTPASGEPEKAETRQIRLDPPDKNTSLYPAGSAGRAR